jgi:oligogalacturonide lyase
MMFPMRILLPFLICASLFAQTDPPKSWIDPDTGHRVYRLTDEPGSASLYFNQNGYTPDGKKLVFTTPGGISTFDFERRAVQQVVTGRVRIIEVGHKTSSVFYTKGNVVFVTDIDRSLNVVRR